MATGTRVMPKSGEKQIYGGSGTYANDIGDSKTLTEAVSNFSILKVICFVNNIASSTRVSLLYPTGASASYIPCSLNGDSGYIRCESSNNNDTSRFTLISSSYQSLYISAIYGVY